MINRINFDVINTQRQQRAFKKFESSAVLKLNRDIIKKELEKIKIEKELLEEKNKTQLLVIDEKNKKNKMQELENKYGEIINRNKELENNKVQLNKDILFLKNKEEEHFIKEKELFIKQYELELEDKYIKNIDNNLKLQNQTMLRSKLDSENYFDNSLNKLILIKKYKLCNSSVINTDYNSNDEVEYNNNDEPNSKYDKDTNQPLHFDLELELEEKFKDTEPYEKRLQVYKALEIISVNNAKKLDSMYYLNGCKTIVNCYQTKYEQDKFPTGLGDFMRGSFFLLNFCELFAFYPEIHINHPISFFLHKFNSNNMEDFQSFCKIKADEEKSIKIFDKNNWITNNCNKYDIFVQPIVKIDTMEPFCEHLFERPIIDGNKYIYNILYPYHPIKDEHRVFMKNIMNPSTSMRVLLYNSQYSLDIKNKEYITIHLRCGDDYLIDNKSQFTTNYLKRIMNEIDVIFNANSKKEILLICDNSNIKYYLLKNNKYKLKTLFHPISHIGEGVEIQYESIKNTMIDFYLLSQSSSIFCFSEYSHGSGFSQWCATIYNIPYVCKIISQVKLK